METTTHRLNTSLDLNVIPTTVLYLQLQLKNGADRREDPDKIHRREAEVRNHLPASQAVNELEEETEAGSSGTLQRETAFSP